TVQDLKGLGYEKGKPVGLVGVTELSEAQKKQLKEQQEMQQMYDMIMKHKRAMQEMQMMWDKAIQQHQHGYDSDEEVDSELGTWEHQLRRMEMDKTRGVWGAAVSHCSVMVQRLPEGKGAAADGKELLLLLDCLGLKEWGEVLHTSSQGGPNPTSRLSKVSPGSLSTLQWGGTQHRHTFLSQLGTTAVDGAGFGIDRPAELTKEDDEYEAFRKRMMLAYRFRPNPLVRAPGT
ncbi:SUGP1 protein, partial [Urocolius indicus]|nr:SUGP1 protein [Urocolius indicus]